MSHPTLEVADIFRRYGEAWRARNAAHLSRGQRRVMTAIEICRTAALGGHVERCDDCAHARIAYNSCRNRHCPKCQWRAAEAWLAAREAELLPVPYFHIVFTLPAVLRPIAYHNRREVRHVMIDLCRTIRQDELQRRWSWAGDNIARQYANLTELLYPRDASTIALAPVTATDTVMHCCSRALPSPSSRAFSVAAGAVKSP